MSDTFCRQCGVTDDQQAKCDDGCRPSLLGTRDNARQWSRVKPDEELHPLAELDDKDFATWDEPLSKLLNECAAPGASGFRFLGFSRRPQEQSALLR